MSHHVISVCIFCLLCATHSPCASHSDFTTQQQIIKSNNSLINNVFKEKQLFENVTNKVYNKRESDLNIVNNKSDKDFHLKRIFSKYGNGETMSINGFQQLLKDVVKLSVKLDQSNDVELDVFLSTKSNKTMCVKEEDLLVQLRPQSENSTENITFSTLEAACPVILSNIISGNCDVTEKHNHHHHHHNNNTNKNIYVWLYSIAAVLIISACGVFALIIIPVMQKRFYKPLLQFLVALAVGTLAGDALLHLLPHAMTSNGHEHNDENVWKGFVAMLGLTLFFVMERFIPLACKRRKNKERKRGHSHVKVLNTELDVNKGKDTQCMDKYNPSPFCYKDILNDPNTTFIDADEITAKADDSSKKTSKIKQNLRRNSLNASLKPENSKNNHQNDGTDRRDFIKKSHENHLSTEIIKMLPPTTNNEEKDMDLDRDYTVILREHGANHHGHSHTHGHVHAAPQNFSAVAWMVIMGDGLHNFTDGMAIGAAFSGSITGGFSTAVAVFCHELPHELGDFAMLLKAGMSIKQALFYNILSSVLCILGNVFGVWLGNTDSASSWVFAVAAGTFIYIALVDMIPELSAAHEDEGNLMQCILHLSGLLLGFGIMTLIALFEHDLKNIFNEPV